MHSAIGFVDGQSCSLLGQVCILTVGSRNVTCLMRVRQCLTHCAQEVVLLYSCFSELTPGTKKLRKEVAAGDDFLVSTKIACSDSR